MGSEKLHKRDDMIKGISHGEFSDVRFLAKILEASPLAVIVIKKEGNIIYVNSAAEKLYGYTREEFYSMIYDDIACYEEDDHTKKEIIEAINKDGAWVGENIFFKKSGEKVHIRQSAYHVNDDKGNIIAVVGFHEDISHQKKLEDELLELTKFQQSIIENAKSWIVIIDEENDIVIWNKAAEKLSGYKREEVINNKEIWEWLFPIKKDRLKLLSLVKEVIRKGEGIEHFETIILCKNGKSRIISWNCNTLTNRKDKPIALIATGRDITEIKKAQRERQESEERFKAIFDTAVDAIFIKNRQYEYIQVNPSMASTFGLSVSELIGKTDKDIFDKNATKHFMEIDFRVFKGEIVEEEFTFNFMEKEKTFNIIKVPLYDDIGKISGICGIARDVTDKKLIEEELIKSRQFFHNIIDAIDDPIFVKDLEHKWVLINNKLCELMEHTRKELIGKSDFDFYPPEQAKVFWAIDDIVFKTGESNINEEEITWRGQVHSISTKKSLLIDSATGKKLIVGSIRDLTDRKRMEKELRIKNRELNDFAYRVSHDLKNPINLIRGYIMEIKETPELFDEYFDKIYILSEQLLNLINSLLKLSRAGRIINQKQNIDMESLLWSIYIPYRDKEVPSELIIESEFPPVQGDPQGIEEVFSNLIQNSIKYRDEGKEKLIIKVDCDKDDEKTVINYRDNGSGIDQLFLKKIFDPGFTLARDKGTGFGLAIIKKIIKAHGGDIKVSSEGKNKGTEFVIELPEE